jgi:hypothetical protein
VNDKCRSSDEWAKAEQLIQEDISLKQVANRFELEDACRLAMRPSTNKFTLTHEITEICTNICAARILCRKLYVSEQEKRGTIKNRVTMINIQKSLTQRRE